MTYALPPLTDDGAFEPAALNEFLDATAHLGDREVAEILGVELYRIIYARRGGREMFRRAARRAGGGKAPAPPPNADKARQAAWIAGIQKGHAQGLTQKAIGGTLGISAQTVGRYAQLAGLDFPRGGWGRSR